MRAAVPPCSWPRGFAALTVGALFVAVVGSSCGAEADLRSASFAIWGGDPDDGHPSVVLIHINTANNESQNICTGTLVAPRVVVSAAHCLQPPDAGKKTLIEVDGQCCLEAERVIPHESWTAAGEYRDDIGLAILTQPAPVTPMKLLLAVAPAAGMSLTLVGFGRSAPDEPDTRGVKRVSTSRTIAEVHASHFTVEGTIGNSLLGDSGGPVFVSVGGQEAQIGVQSHSDKDSFVTSYHVRVDAYAEWLEAAAATAGLTVETIEPAAPQVQIVTPQDGAAVGEEALVVSVSVTANNPITRVEIHVDGELTETLSEQPYTASLPLSSGEHQLVAVAYDEFGLSGTSRVTVTAGSTTSGQDAGAPLFDDGTSAPGADGGSGQHRASVLHGGGCSVGSASGSRFAHPFELVSLFLLALLWHRRRLSLSRSSSAASAW